MGEEDRTRGNSRPDEADASGESGWITTEVAARAVRVSPRTIRRYIDQGKLEARPQGGGVNRTWLVSVDSLHALRASRTIEEESPRDVRAEDSMADVFRELATRLEQRAAEAAELRTRLELTERTQSTLEDDRRRAMEELAEERRRREAAERERDDLRRKLDTWRRLEESAEATAHEIHDRLAEERSGEEPPASPEPREEPDTSPVRPERAQPAVPVDPQREEPERVRPERVEPERVEPQESLVTAADEQQGRGPIPDAEGPQTAREGPFTEEHEPRRGLWRRLFGR